MEKEKFYIVRGDKSGVFACNIVEMSGQKIKMKNVKRLWYWDGACSISQLAVDGTTKPDNCKFTVTVDNVTILDGIEINECTKKAEKSIKEVNVWKM